MAGNDGLDSKRLQPRMGVKPPYLAIGIGAVLNRSRTLRADLWSAKLTEAARDAQAVYSYVATLSTQGDIELYRQTRNVVTKPFIFGNDSVRQFLEELRARTRPDEMADDIITTLVPGRRPIVALESPS